MQSLGPDLSRKCGGPSRSTVQAMVWTLPGRGLLSLLELEVGSWSFSCLSSHANHFLPLPAQVT